MLDGAARRARRGRASRSTRSRSARRRRCASAPGRTGITELRPGNYVYFDRTQVALGAASLDDCALTVLATVVSQARRRRIILDCGSKTLTNDQARGITAAAGYGAVLAGDGRLDSRASRRDADDRAAVGGARDRPRRPARRALEPGDRVRVLPNHSCVVSNLVDEVRLVDGDRGHRDAAGRRAREDHVDDADRPEWLSDIARSNAHG